MLAATQTFLLSLQSKCSISVKAAMTEVPEWTECHISPFQLAKTGVWESSPGSLGEKCHCQQWPERNWHSFSAPLYSTSNTLGKWNGISSNCVIWLFILTRDKISGFCHETSDINHFGISVSEAALDSCACAKHSVT